MAAMLTIRGRGRRRLAFAGASLACIVAAILLVRWTVVEIYNPFAGPPDASTSAEIVTAVLDNVHAAYLERVDTKLTAALEKVISDEGAAAVRAELDRALAIKVAGGGIARVNAIDDLEVTDIGALDGRPGFRTLATWTARASASHWGHVHLRRIRFRALMELTEIDGAWKITGLTVVESQQLS